MVLFPQNINLRQSSRWRCSWCFAAAYCTISSALLQLSLSQRLDLPVPIETLAEFEATLCQQVVVLFQVLAAEINFGCKVQVPLPHPPAPPVHPGGGRGGMDAHNFYCATATARFRREFSFVMWWRRPSEFLA